MFFISLLAFSHIVEDGPDSKYIFVAITWLSSLLLDLRSLANSSAVALPEVFGATHVQQLCNGSKKAAFYVGCGGNVSPKRRVVELLYLSIPYLSC